MHANEESADPAAGIEREKIFYRELLEQICQDPRKTRARRLAESGLTFWDKMQEEAKKPKPAAQADSPH